ncbi:SCO6880 family protein [Nocardioides sp. Bht2]|uniref:SCO6880 family protein n=1 Tax=Nocardioides sp. Bht2 TaxID=3392297 RepID=UPI0039B3E5A9
MSETQQMAPRVLFGNWIRQESSGIKGASAAGSTVLVAGMGVAGVLLVAAGPLAGLVAAFLVVAVFSATTTPVRRLGQRVGFLVQRARGEHQWRSGVFSRNQERESRLPGMLGGVELLEKADAFGVHGEQFAVLHNPRVGGLYTVVAKCIADGPWMQDQTQVDLWVASYANVLSALGHDHAIICAKAITETAPDPGGRLAAMVGAGRVAGAPAVARGIIDQVVAAAPATSSENVTYLELTFRGRTLDRKGRRDVILSELARRVPGVRGRLEAAGGGAVTMVTANELPGIVRAAYDPEAQVFLERAALAGSGPTAVDWKDAGPVSYQEAWDHLLHDSGRSVTWEMAEAPRQSLNERSLTALLAPHSDFARKRVAIIYRPHTPAEAAQVSENDVDTAVFNADQGKKRISARSRLRVKATERSRDEVALGAGMVRFSLLITATVHHRDGDLDQAVSTIEAGASSVLMRLRRSYGSQAAGFVATLPVGFVPWIHTVVPDKIRDLL